MEFPETTWGVVRAASDGRARSRESLEKLCRRYWEPIASFARYAWASPGEDPNDLAQDFFVWLMEGDVLAKYLPEKGSFRGFMKGLLRNFARNRNLAARRQKRGGGKRARSLDDSAGTGEAIADTRAKDPEEEFDRAWRDAVTRRAVERVKSRCAETALHAKQWAAFEEYELATGERPTYAEIAAKLGAKESDVRNWLFAVRERMRVAVRAELADTVTTSADLEEEWQAFVSS